MFSVSIPDSLLNNSLTFSSIGFNDKSCLINSLKNRKTIEIVLDEKLLHFYNANISRESIVAEREAAYLNRFVEQKFLR